MGNSAAQAAASGDVARDGYAYIYEFEHEDKDYVSMEFWLTDGLADASTDTSQEQDEVTWQFIEDQIPEDQIPDEEES
jgi:hypothetical protein